MYLFQDGSNCSSTDHTSYSRCINCGKKFKMTRDFHYHFSNRSTFYYLFSNITFYYFFGTCVWHIFSASKCIMVFSIINIIIPPISFHYSESTFWMYFTTQYKFHFRFYFYYSIYVCMSLNWVCLFFAELVYFFFSESSDYKIQIAWQNHVP